MVVNSSEKACQGLAAAFFLAGAARVALRATLDADEDVFFRFGHSALLQWVG